ncbi:MAG: hypothetical protein RLZZ214_1558 [Verrucomicrobiota bacterium]
MKPFRSPLILIPILLAAPQAWADDYTWTQNSVATQTWTTADNWLGSTVFSGPGGDTDTLAFFEDTTTPLLNGTNAIITSVPALTLNTLTLKGLGAAATAAAVVNIGTAGGTTWTLDGTAPTVNLSGLAGAQPLTYTVAQKLALSQTTTFTGNGTANFNFSGVISGSAGLVKSGTSTMGLNGGNTYSGTTTVNGGTLGLAGSAAKISSSSLAVTGDGTFRIDNNLNSSATNRLGDLLAIHLAGGTFSYLSGNSATNSTETVGVITTAGDRNVIRVSPTSVNGLSGNAGNATLTAASLNHTPGNAVLLVNGLKLGQDSSSTGTGRFLLTAAPTLVGTTAATNTGINSAAKDTVIVPYLVGEAGTAMGAVGTASGTPNTFVTYNAETGLRPMNLNDEFTQNAITAGTNVRTNTDTSVANSVSINALVVANATTNILISANRTLTIASGAILWTGGTTGAQIKGASLNNGAKLDFGSQEAMLTVNSARNGEIAVIITGSGGLTKSGGGTLTLSGANTYSGDTTVSAGTLSLTTVNSNNDSSKVTIASGAFLNLNHALSETVGSFYIDAVLQAEGTYVADGTQTGLEIGTPRITGGGKLVVSSSPPANDFTAWIEDFSVGALTGANDDFDHDGLANAVENILGSDPSLTNPGLTGISATGSTFKFSHHQSNTIASDVAKSYQWSTDLVEWKASGENNAGGTSATIAEATITDNAAPANDVIEVTVTVTGGSSAKVFGRLVATKAP